MTHELKIRKQWADAKLAGEKPFEIRINDRGFQKGDIVRYKVIDPKTNEPWRADDSGTLATVHPLECCDFLITYVIEDKEGLERGYCVFADTPVPKNGTRTEKSVPKSSDGCKDFEPSANGTCVHMRWDVDGRPCCTCSGSERNGLPCRR